VLLLNIRHLYCALEIRKFSNLSEAARQVHLTQSALTQSIKKLEDKIGFRLFSRGTTGMYVSEAGDVFLKRFERAFALLEQYASGQFTTDRTARITFLRGINSRQLSAIIKMVELQNYTHAARVLDIAQPTLHRTMRDLEALCSVTLFNRSPSGAEPTWRARRLARVAGLYFAELQQGFDEVKALDGKHFGTLKIGSLPLALSELVPATVLKVMDAVPQSDVSIVDGPYEEQLHALLHGDIDVLIGALRPPDMEELLEQVPLFEDRLSLVARADHPILHADSMESGDWQQVQWIVPKKETPARLIFDEFIVSRKLPVPHDVIECNSLTAIRGLLMKSDRVAMLPARQVEVDVRAGLLAICDMKLKDPPRAIGYTIRKDWVPTKLQNMFISVLHAECAAESTISV